MAGQKMKRLWKRLVDFERSPVYRGYKSLAIRRFKNRLWGKEPKEIAKMGGVVPALIESFSSQTIHIRDDDAVKALAIIGKRAVPALIKAARSKDYLIRLGALRALGEIGDPSTIPAIVENFELSANSLELKYPDSLFDRKEMSGIKHHAATALGKTGKAHPGNPEIRKVIGRLIVKLREGNIIEREEAAIQLGLVHHRSAVPALIEATRDRNGQVRFHAVKALGEIGDATAIPALVAALDYEDYRVFEVTSHLILSMKKVVIEALVKFGLCAVPVLKEILDSREYSVRREVVESLGSIEDPISVLILIEALRSEKSDVREEAVPRLEKLRVRRIDTDEKPEIVGSIMKLMNSDWFMAEAQKNSEPFLAMITALDSLFGKIQEQERQAA